MKLVFTVTVTATKEEGEESQPREDIITSILDSMDSLESDITVDGYEIEVDIKAPK